MKTFKVTIGIAAMLMPLSSTRAHETTDARVHEAFTVAWQALHDTRTDPNELAVRLYKEAWLGPSYASVRFADAMPASENKPYPEDASAESIIHGDHGNASSWRLWELTYDICLDIFSKRPKPVIKAMAADFQGDVNARKRTVSLLFEWQRYILFHQPPPHGPYLMEKSDSKKKWDQIVRELYPPAAKCFRELRDPDPYADEPLTYILRDLGDPRAIPVLLGKAGRNIQYFELLLHLQHNRKADPGLVKLLADPDAEVRWRATYALMECADPKMTPKAMLLLQDKSPKVRHEALYLAFSLLSTQRPELEKQFKALLADPDPEVRQTTVILLVQRKDVACGPALLELLRNEKLGEGPHNRLVQAMRNLTGEYFGYQIGSDVWQPTTPNNRAALDKFAAWLGGR